MAIYLAEDEVGVDANTIGYPHLLLCMGVTVVMDDGSLIGAHVSSNDTEQLVMGQLLFDITAHRGQMTQLYCCADVKEHCGVHHCMDINGKANALRFQGPGYLFDFGYINPRDGAYVEVTSTGADSLCTLRFKRNEKVDYDRGTGTMVTRATKVMGRDNISVRPSNTVAVGGRAKTPKFGIQRGNHSIKTVPATSLKKFDL